MVSCHPTLMLQVVRKMVASGAIQWSAALNKLADKATPYMAEYATRSTPYIIRYKEYVNQNMGLEHLGMDLLPASHSCHGRANLCTLTRPRVTPCHAHVSCA